jgi:carboxymethylenebutenolidase
MDLHRYVDDELAEERAFEHASAQAQHGDGTNNPGDPDVEVPVTDVRSCAHEVVIGGQPRTMAAVSSLSRRDSAPGVVVIHENKGLVPYIENTARRLATEGFVAVAPDLLAPVGGTMAFDSIEAAIEALTQRAPEDMVQDLRAVLDALAADERVDADRLAMVGFCFGGGLAWRVLAKHPGLTAGVPFYGAPPPAQDLARVEAPVLAIYGEPDERITSTMPSTRETMAAHDRPFESLVAPGVGHAFHNDTNPDRYRAASARAAWDQAVAYLHRALDDQGSAS